jgi:hypothetical protein
VRSRWVARDFKDPKESARDEFSAAPPLEMIRLMLSRQAAVRKDKRERKTMYLDMEKARLAPVCSSDVYEHLYGAPGEGRGDPERDLIGVVPGDDFVWEGKGGGLDWVLNLLEKQYELKNRVRLRFGLKPVRKTIVELTEAGIKWTEDSRHQQFLEVHFGMNDDAKVTAGRR